MALAYTEILPKLSHFGIQTQLYNLVDYDAFKFYRRYYNLISKFKVGLKSLLRQGLSEPDFYGDLVY